jgi:alpha-tubulin suppressor-like RCC1 family protein
MNTTINQYFIDRHHHVVILTEGHLLGVGKGRSTMVGHTVEHKKRVFSLIDCRFIEYESMEM